MNYVDLDINGTSGTHKIKDTSVSYAQVVIPRSRKEQSNENNQHVNQTDQQVNQNDQQKKAASLKVCCPSLISITMWHARTWLYLL